MSRNAPPFAIPDLTVPELFLAAAATCPDRTALDFLGHTVTYAALAHKVRQLAAGLQIMGVGPGKRVALMLPNSPYYVLFYQAVLMAGGVVLNLNPLYTTPEIAELLKLTDTRLVVSLDHPGHVKKILAARRQVPLENVIVCPLGPYLPAMQRLAYRALGLASHRALTHPLVTGYETLLASPASLHAPTISAGDLAVLQPTGGTTGSPKAARLTHGNLVANTAQIRTVLGQPREGGEIFLCLLPFFHVFANTALLNLGLATGSTLVLLPRFALKTFLATVRRTRPTITGAVPALLATLAESKHARKEDLASLTHIISGGAALPVPVAEAFTAKFGHMVNEGYGLTEASPVVACNPLGSPRLGTVGKLLPGTEVKIMALDNPSRAARKGGAGHILVRGPQVMQGYDGAPEETKAVLKKGWLHTGDIGTLDADGYLSITDRSKDMIVVNGYKVFPRQVEDALALHPAVAEALVVPHAHPHKGQVPHAYVRLNRGAAVTEETLLAFVATRLNPFARPARVHLRAELPKTPLGKPCRKTLLRQINEGN